MNLDRAGYKTRNADERTRTITLLLGADFESAASTISPHRHKNKVLRIP